MAFPFRGNLKHWTDGQTDRRGVTLNAALYGIVIELYVKCNAITRMH